MSPIINSRAEEFRKLAAEADRIAEEMESSGRFADPAKVSPGASLRASERLERMGQLIIDAWEAGFLRDIPGLSERVEYHRSAGPATESIGRPGLDRLAGRPLKLARRGMNLVREVVEEVLPAAFPRRFPKTQLTMENALRKHAAPDGGARAPRTELFGRTVLEVFVEEERRTARAFRFMAEKVSEPPAPPADPFGDLRKFASAELKGIERAVIEALCGAAGKYHSRTWPSRTAWIGAIRLKASRAHSGG